jgi:hypothetical protein
MRKKLVFGSVVAIVIFVLPTSMAVVIENTNLHNNGIIDKLDLEYPPRLVFTLIIGKISNLTKGGSWTPCYNFHIERVITLSTWFPFFRVRYDKNARIVIPTFSGFIDESFIIGISYTLYIYNSD